MLPIPLKIEKIPFLQAVRYIAVLIPGIVIVAAIAMASPEDFHEFMRVPELGYYAKLSFLVAAAYLIGFVLDEVVTMVVGFIFGALGGWLLKSEKRRTIIDTLLLALAPWRNVNWQKLAAAYLGPNLTPDAEAEPQWRFWYLVIKAGVPKLEERFIRTSVMADAVQTCSWALLTARIVVPGHRYLVVLVVFTFICFLVSGVNKLIMIGVSFGYFPGDLTGADLGAAMLDEIRKEKLK
jgi:hypothetical protein